MVKSIDYTKYDFDELLEQIQEIVKEKGTFSNINLEASYISTLLSTLAHCSQYLNFYIHAGNNEPFLQSAKTYGNVLKQASYLGYKPKVSIPADVEIQLYIEIEDVFENKGASFTFEEGKLFGSSAAIEGTTLNFVLTKDFTYTINKYGLSALNGSDLLFTTTAVTTGATGESEVIGAALSDHPQITDDEFDGGSVYISTSNTNPLTIQKDGTLKIFNDTGTITSKSTFTTNSDEFNLFLRDGFTDEPYLEIADHEEGGELDSTERIFLGIIRREANNKLYFDKSVGIVEKRVNKGYLGVKYLNESTITTTVDARNNITKISIDPGDKGLKILLNGEIITYTTLIQTPDLSQRTFDSNRQYYLILRNVGRKFTSNAELDISYTDPVLGEVRIAEIDSDSITSGGSIRNDTSTISFLHLNESTTISDLSQGEMKTTKLSESGIVDYEFNDLDITVNDERQLIIGDTSISQDGIIVRVLTDGAWLNWEEVDNIYTNDQISSTSRIFMVSITQDRKVMVSMGNTRYGQTPIGKNAIIIKGINTEGSGGNLQGDGLNSTLTVNLSNDVAITITLDQPEQAINGADAETIDEIRTKAPAIRRPQDRLVSVSDYEDFLSTEFRNIISDVKVMNYDDLKDNDYLAETILPALDIENEFYYFNTLFIFFLPLAGDILSNTQKQTILHELNKEFRYSFPVNHIIRDTEKVPVDIVCRYTRKANDVYSATYVESQITANIESFFSRSNRTLGEIIYYSDVLAKCAIEEIAGAELLINIDRDQQYVAKDYILDNIQFHEHGGETSELERLLITRATNIENILNTRISENFNVSQAALQKLYQPLFNYENVDQKVLYPFSFDLFLMPNQFIVIDDIVLKEKS